MPTPHCGPRSAFREVLRRCERYAAAPWPVLLCGETGVGNEVLARHLHAASPRRRGPFVPVNCTALPATLFESELFGHEKGAFSGASQYFRGLFRCAQGGTLFLDEIGDLERGLQVKLLRVLETGEVRAVGSTREERVQVRFVAATNVDLRESVRQGSFRHDLYQRLSVLKILVPSLRDRAEDIPLIAREICREIGAQWELTAPEALQTYHWPGNVRQLKNVLIRAAVLSDMRLRDHELHDVLGEERAAAPDHSFVDPLHGTLAEVERRVIVDTLKRCQGNRKRAAKELGIAKSTLHEKLRRWREEGGPEVAWTLVRGTDSVLVADNAIGSAPGLDL